MTIMEERTNGARSGGRVPPHNFDAEEGLLGTMLLTLDAQVQGFDLVEARDFYKPAHEEIFDSMVAVAGMAEINPVTVAEELRKRGRLDFCGGTKFLRDLQGSAPVSSHAKHFAVIIRELATCRRAIAHAGDVAEAAYASDLEALNELIYKRADLVMRHAGLASIAESEDVLDLVATDHVYDWIVPGLFERGDWYMITGKEGGGKTTYIRQMDVQIAAGIHPFKLLHQEPRRVIHFDFQDSQGQSGREFEKLLKCAVNAGRPVAPGMLKIVTSKGFNILDRFERRWFEHEIESQKAEIVSFGPLYKIYNAPAGMSKHDEQIAEEVAGALDLIASRTGCAYLIEAHAPHGNANDRAGWRPIGASLWQRHPHFGHGLQPRSRSKDDRTIVGVTLRRWREDRDQSRELPFRLDYGGEGRWPWLAPPDELF